RGYAVLAPILRIPIAPVVAFAIVVGLLSQQADLYSSLLVATSMALAIGACVVSARNSATPFLTFAPLRRVRVVSYGMYLFHQPILTALHGVGALHPVPLFLAGAVATYGLAEISFRTFEKPFRRLKARFHPTAPAAQVGAAMGSPEVLS